MPQVWLLPKPTVVQQLAPAESGHLQNSAGERPRGPAVSPCRSLAARQERSRAGKGIQKLRLSGANLPGLAGRFVLKCN